MDRNKEHNTGCGYPTVSGSTPRNVSGLQSIYAFTMYYERYFTVDTALGTTQHYDLGNGIELPNDTASPFLNMYETLGGNPALVNEYSVYIRDQSPISTFMGQGPTHSNRQSAIAAFLNLSPLTPSQFSDPVLRDAAGVVSVTGVHATTCASGCGSSTQFDSSNCPSSEPSQQVTYVRGAKINLGQVNMSTRWEINGAGIRYVPDNLIDGNRNTIVTTDGQNPDNGDGAWVSARILDPSKRIGDVELTNRPHAEYQRFLGNFEVWLTNTAGDTTSNAQYCGNYTTEEATGLGPFTVNCEGRRGNWVTVKQIYGPSNSYVNGKRYLTPSELKVYVAEPATTTVTGCMNRSAFNYDADATVNVGCIGPEGTVLNTVTDEYLCRSGTGRSGQGQLPSRNGANTADANCGQRRVLGCMIRNAFNYDAAATVNGGCIGPEGTVLVVDTYLCRSGTGRSGQGRLPSRNGANTADANCGESPVRGCTDINADNYDASANVDDNSCTYSNTGTITDTNFGIPFDTQAVYNGVDISGCVVATDSSGCTGVKINVSRNVTNGIGASRTLVRHLCCGTLAEARNAETTLNNAHRIAKTTIGGYSSLGGQAYNNITSVFF